MTSTTVTISLTREDVDGCWHTGGEAQAFIRQTERFECSDPVAEADMPGATRDASSLFELPAFKDGSVLHCDGYSEALLLTKVHRGLGFTAYLLWDMKVRDDGAPYGCAVLTSCPLAD